MNSNSDQFAFSFITHPPRPEKPRQNGITMVLDKNLTVEETEQLVAVAKNSIDLVKFGWGTSVIFEKDIIRQKCEILRDANIKICPGGTLGELAFLQGVFPEFLKEAKELGFTCIEVSNGTVTMSEDEKCQLIKRSLDEDFTVVSEVGSKAIEEDSRLDIQFRIDSTQSELEVGVWKVIFEARESGTLGIFDTSGKTQFSMLDQLTSEIDSRDIIFEAPQKSQQVDLIKRLGPNVNLGNIAPAEIISLETLRLGLRGDTLRHFHLVMPKLSVELGPSGALDASRRGDVIIMVDAIRASTTIITALAHGMKSVRPVHSVEECQGDLTAGERGGKKIPDLDFDNSPLSFATDEFKGRELVLTTTNGTECLLSASSNQEAIVLVGAPLNLTAVTKHALELAKQQNKNISVVVAGRNNQPVVEDVLVAAEIALLLPGAPLSTNLELKTSNNIVSDFLTSQSGENLSSLGRTDDVIWCAQVDKFDVVPVYKDGIVVLAETE